MELLDQQEAAAVTRLSERTLERHRAAGTGPKFLKLCRRVLYRRDDLEQWLIDCTCRSTAEAFARACGKTESAPISIARSIDPPVPPAAEISIADSGRYRGRKKIGRFSSHTASATGVEVTR